MKTKYSIVIVLLFILQVGECQHMKVNKKPSKQKIANEDGIDLKAWPKGTYVLSPITNIDGKTLPTPTCTPDHYEVDLPKDLPSCGGGTRTQDYKVCVPKGGSTDLPTDNVKPLEKEVPIVAKEIRPSGYMLDTIPRNNAVANGDRSVAFNNLTVGAGGNSTIITGDQINIYVNQTGCCCGSEAPASLIDSNKIKLGLVVEVAINFLVGNDYPPINGVNNYSAGIGIQYHPRKNVKLQLMVRKHFPSQFSVPMSQDTCHCGGVPGFGAYSISARAQYIVPIGKSKFSWNSGIYVDQVINKSDTPLDVDDQKNWELPNWISVSTYIEYTTYKKGSGMYMRAGLTYDGHVRTEAALGVFLD